MSRSASDGHREVVPTQPVGALLRARRAELGLTLQQVADRAGCVRSYVSEIENNKRSKPPSDELLVRLEEALSLPPGRLVDAAVWSTAPAELRREIEQSRKAAARLQRLIDSAQGHEGVLDSAYQRGELSRLLGQLGGEDRGGVSPVGLPTEVPLINKVAAGYPSEFTDLGYPARTADEYVRVPELDDADAFAARVVGDSMVPEYREGDIVVFSPARSIESGMDCFARLEPDHETTFKRVYFEGTGRIRLQPLNSSYPPRVLDRESVAGLYAAVTVMRSI